MKKHSSIEGKWIALPPGKGSWYACWLPAIVIWLAVGFSTFSPLVFAIRKKQFWKAQQSAIAALSATDPKWCDFVFHENMFARVRVNAGEIRIKGIMYDMATISEKGDSVYVRALADFEESHWMAVQLNQKQQEAPTAQAASSYVFLLYFFQQTAVPDCFDPDLKQGIPVRRVGSLTVLVARVIVPPPEDVPGLIG